MKKFLVHLLIEIAALLGSVIVAGLLVKSDHPTLGLTTLSTYGVVMFWRFGIEKINTEYMTNMAAARQRRLETALAAAATEALWISDVVQTSNLTTYIIDVPGHGRFLVDFPTKKNTTTTDSIAQVSDKD